MDDTTPARRRLPWQAVVAATVLALLAAGAVLLLAAGDDDAVPQVDGTLQLTPDDGRSGDPLTLEVVEPDGTTTTLADRVGEPMVVNFFASWCTPCITEMPDFEAVHQRLGDDVQFVGLAVQDRPEDAARIADETGITYEWMRDPKGDVANAAGVVQMPTTIFISADGTIVATKAGVVDDDELLELIAEHFGIET